MDMITLLRSNGIPVYQRGDGIRDKHISSNRQWYQMVCPICGTDHLWLGYNAEHDYFNCFNHGHVTKYELFRAWFPQYNPSFFLDQLDTATEESRTEVEHRGYYDPPTPVLPLCDFKRHVAYIKGRGLDPEQMERVWGFGALPADAELPYRDRIFIPVANRDGIRVSWQARTILSFVELRYLAAPKHRESTPIKYLLYGEHLANPFHTLIVTEGVFDAVAIGPNAVATFGKTITPQQKRLISNYHHRIICFDSEPDTQEQARELALSLSCYPGITENICLDAPDPATAPKKEIDALLKHAELV